MWSTLGKVTPLAETYTFSHFPTRIPNNFTYSVLFLKRLRSVLMQPWTYLHKSAKVNTGLVVKWRLFGTWCKERRAFVVALSECFLSWLLTTGANKGSLWEDPALFRVCLMSSCQDEETEWQQSAATQGLPTQTKDAFFFLGSRAWEENLHNLTEKTGVWEKEWENIPFNYRHHLYSVHTVQKWITRCEFREGISLWRKHPLFLLNV